MKVLALFYVEFCEWPRMILSALGERTEHLEVCVIVVRDQTVMGRLRSDNELHYSAIEYLPDQEQAWLGSQSTGPAEWPSEAMVERVIRGDRHVGSRHATGGVIPETPISRACGTEDAAKGFAQKQLQWLRDIFEREKPDLVLTYLPEDAASLAAALLAEEMSVPFLTFASARFGHRFMFFSDAAGACPLFGASDNDDEAHRVLESYRAKPQPPGYSAFNTRVTFSLPPLIDLAALAWWTLIRRPPDVPSYPYPGARLTWELRRWSFAHILYRLRQLWCDALPSPSQPYVFFPLQVDPEAGSIVAAPNYTDQIALIRTLAKAVPTGWEIVVKEHIPMLGRRPRGFYRKLRACPGVRLVAPDVPLHTLIDGAQLTVVVTGTAGMEAVLAGRKALFLGPTPLGTVVPGCHHCHDIGEIAAMITKAASEPGPSDEAVLAYLRNLLESSFDVLPHHFFGGLRTVTPEIVSSYRNQMEWLIDKTGLANMAKSENRTTGQAS
ncbi:hypothetical protein L2D14_08045 [Thalassospiraceae bacterium LMO-JJ14]|nr:hypothetical protein L2D14_08045 [Thalassospiraceae bacterium LMO-JJ14]